MYTYAANFTDPTDGDRVGRVRAVARIENGLTCAAAVAALIVGVPLIAVGWLVPAIRVLGAAAMAAVVVELAADHRRQRRR